MSVGRERGRKAHRVFGVVQELQHRGRRTYFLLESMEGLRTWFLQPKRVTLLAGNRVDLQPRGKGMCKRGMVASDGVLYPRHRGRLPFLFVHQGFQPPLLGPRRPLEELLALDWAADGDVVWAPSTVPDPECDNECLQ